VDEFWQDAVSRPHSFQKMPVTRNNPMSWENENWPSKSKFLMNYLALGQCAFNNRTNENIYKVFCEIFGETKLWCSIDKWGFMRATKDLLWLDDEGRPCKIDRPDWRKSLLPHWDCNPWVYVQMLHRKEPNMYQGLVALEDCPVEVGGFLSTPGCIRFLKTWTEERKTPHKKWISHRIQINDPMVNHLQKVPLRKGELVIFDTGQLHCNFENNSSKYRLFQFIRMMPATRMSRDKDRFSPTRAMEDKMYRHIDLNKTIKLTPLGRRLIGLDDWDIENGHMEEENEKEPEKV